MLATVFFFMLCVPLGYPEYTFKTSYIDVPVDHFSFTSNKTFGLRYLTNDQYYVKGGPIFFYAGNEADITVFAFNTGFLFDIAPQFNALIVFAEHRYYGRSMPFGNKSFSSLEYLGYLTSSQALADFVYLLDKLKDIYFNTMISRDTYPIIAFGGSYGGMLATWLRIKYPHVVLGAIASSAPILMFENQIPCGKFYEIITETFNKNKNCSKFIRISWDTIRNVSKTEIGRKALTKKLRLCSEIKTKEDVEDLIDWLADVYVNLAMVDYPYATNFVKILPAFPVQIFCKKLDSFNITDNKELLEALVTALEVYTNYSGTVPCNVFKPNNSDLNEMGWDFQACTEMVMPLCSTDKDMFETQPWDSKHYQKDCEKRFGVKLRRTDLVPLEYGGINLRYASNIVFSNGLADPWTAGGVLNNVSSTVVAITIPDAAHHFDIRGADLTDSNYVKEARKFHIHFIKKWLNIL